jgi:hypothetical protein
MNTRFTNPATVCGADWGYIDYQNGGLAEYHKLLESIRAFLPNARMLTTLGLAPADGLTEAMLNIISDVFPAIRVYDLDGQKILAMRVFRCAEALYGVSQEYVEEGYKDALRDFGASESFIQSVLKDFDGCLTLNPLGQAFTEYSIQACGGYEEWKAEHFAAPVLPEDTIETIAVKMFVSIGHGSESIEDDEVELLPLLAMFKFGKRLFNADTAVIVSHDQLVAKDAFMLMPDNESFQRLVMALRTLYEAGELKRVKLTV